MISREEILKKIQEGAKENKGIPLSTKKFEEKTGIIPYEWHKYWPKFGDAQREAGFLPNKFFKIPYDESFLLEKFISLMRESKKWPTKGEMVVKRTNNKDFPSEKVFYDRLGLKPALVGKVLEYAKNKNYDDVVKICSEIIREFESRNNSSEENVDKEKHGWVYLGKSGSNYKIGFTKDIIRRYNEITIQLPEGLIHIHDIETDDPSGIETYWHERFKSKRKNGEWFSLSATDVKAFKRWKRIV